VEEIFARVKNSINRYGNVNVSTCVSLCVTSLKNSYVRGRVFPFINIPIRYWDKELLGLYEYCDQLPPSEQYIYCDFVVHAIYYAENKEPAYIKAMEERARTFFTAKGYDIIQFEDGMATITIDRQVFEYQEKFHAMLISLLDEAIKMQTEII
jgi:hypothetical protein